MNVTASLVDIRPDVKYQGTVHEYITVLSVGDEVFGVHDYDMRAEKFESGETCIADLSLSVLSDVEIVDREWKGIRPNDETPEDYLHHSFGGEILSIDRGSPLRVTVDLGIGTADLNLGGYASQETIDSVSVGDFITFTVSNTRLHGLEPA